MKQFDKDRIKILADIFGNNDILDVRLRAYDKDYHLHLDTSIYNSSINAFKLNANSLIVLEAYFLDSDILVMRIVYHHKIEYLELECSKIV